METEVKKYKSAGKIKRALEKPKKKKSYKVRAFKGFVGLAIGYILLRTISYTVVYVEKEIVWAYDSMYKQLVEQLATENGYIAKKEVKPEVPKDFSIKRQLIIEMKAIGASPGLYPLLRGMVKRESGDSPYAESHAGAMGLMGLMPATVRKCGYENPKEAYDPVKNIRCGVSWFMKMMASQKNNVIMAMKEYNAGKDRIDMTEENRNYPKDVFQSMLSLPKDELIYDDKY